MVAGACYGIAYLTASASLCPVAELCECRHNPAESLKKNLRAKSCRILRNTRILGQKV